MDKKEGYTIRTNERNEKKMRNSEIKIVKTIYGDIQQLSQSKRKKLMKKC